MATYSYFKINDIDFSSCVSKLDIKHTKKYNAQENAEGDTVIDYINSKYTISVGIIPLDNQPMKDLLAQLGATTDAVSITFRNPVNGNHKTISCFLPENSLQYYQIKSASNVRFQAFDLTFVEL